MPQSIPPPMLAQRNGSLFARAAITSIFGAQIAEWQDCFGLTLFAHRHCQGHDRQRSACAGELREHTATHLNGRAIAVPIDTSFEATPEAGKKWIRLVNTDCYTARHTGENVTEISLLHSKAVDQVPSRGSFASGTATSEPPAQNPQAQDGNCAKPWSGDRDLQWNSASPKKALQPAPLAKWLFRPFVATKPRRMGIRLNSARLVVESEGERGLMVQILGDKTHSGFLCQQQKA